MSRICIICVEQLVLHIRFDLAQTLLLLVVLGQACVSWPIGEDWVFWRRTVGWIHIGSGSAVKKAGFQKILMKVAVFDPNK